ncbi:MAG TPA: hypothetical protein VK656_07605 [Candidatus Acidoferrum sp.]|jgi:hypothetical protein|nr:hypothetical protein [Candidatus Acidoferrum sp.]
MAKRQRTRPGQRPPSRPNRPATRPVVSRPAGSLSEAEETRAAELEQEIVVRERAAEAARARSRDRRPVDPGVRAEARARGGTLVAASVEYEYVRRDVQRIVRVGGSLILLLAVLFLLIDVFGVVKL